MPHAKSVPCGIETLGFLRSPEIFAPAGTRGKEYINYTCTLHFC